MFVLPVSSDYSGLELAGAIMVASSTVKPSKFYMSQFPANLDVVVDCESTTTVDQIIELLNIGIKQVVVETDVFTAAMEAGLPAHRFAVRTANPESIQAACSIVVAAPLATAESRAVMDGNRTVYIDATTSEIDQATAVQYRKQGYVPIIKGSKLATSNASGKINIAELFTATLTTDRPDGLFTTLVTASGAANTALGVVYSSIASIHESFATASGVYQSRKRTTELWYKGATSGATQRLVAVGQDCDNDVVRFVVDQRAGTGFCHNEKNYTCFADAQLYNDSPGQGLARLSDTLASRKATAPAGSYTKRLFEDEKLLVAKMKEELDELIEAGRDSATADNGKNEVAWEAADLFYFAMVWCQKYGVSLADIERNLDIKAGKVTRRKGDAKAAYLEKPAAETQPAETKPAEKEEAPEPAEIYKLTTIDTTTSPELIAKALTRPVQKTSDIMKLVLPIVQNVQANGDKALLELTAKFDGVTLESPVLKAPFPEDWMNISDDMKEAIDLSIANIEKFHAAQLPKEHVLSVETAPGVICSRFAKPIENVGLYVPGGTAVLPSTAMMLGVPAKVAGCKNIILALPPSRATGKLTPEVVYVAHKLGAKCIVMAGGAQAVTAMAYGTESVLKCDKILGPGNQFVTAAKMYVQNDTQALCSIDMPAGPSEVLVIADGKADPDFVASDLLSQAEHGVDSQVILIGVNLSAKELAGIEEAVARQAAVLPRKEIVAKCLAHSYTLLVPDYDEAFRLSNEYAPEHLILQIEDAPSYVPDYVDNAGSVFVGGLSPESCGDYSSGTNHTLPTYGYARQYSGVNTATFQKFITSQEVSKEGLKSIGKAVMTIAAVEGLEAHRNAVQVRMDKLGL